MQIAYIINIMRRYLSSHNIYNIRYLLSCTVLPHLALWAKEAEGLVCCKNKSCVQELKLKNNSLEDIKYRYMNRDINSVLNMRKIVTNLIESNNRPTSYIRK